MAERRNLANAFNDEFLFDFGQLAKLHTALAVDREFWLSGEWGEDVQDHRGYLLGRREARIQSGRRLRVAQHSKSGLPRSGH